MKQRVVITGLGIISPLGLNVETTWEGLVAGRSGIDTISAFPLDGLETTIAAEVKGFDPVAHFGPKEARRMDRFVQLAAVAALEALASSGLKIDDGNRNRVSVMIASGIGGIITLSEQIGVMKDKGAERVSPFLVPMMLPDMASGRVSMLLGAKGPCVATVSACASGADAIGMASDLLQRGDAEVVLAGGSEAAICPIGVAGFNACQALSKRNKDPQKA
ncbi:MAG: beta-ketoacyl-[acyl-carrier-protein] synthase II, partial [SAR202 cluster bacterium]|nr:beta-ketoacyl-[acyl-carrier-protein] synthase II [SAR202 cluster bacterium]